MSRDDVLCMMRIKNEGRWIRRSLERTWQVAKTVVIFDDHSTDNTFTEAVGPMGKHYDGRNNGMAMTLWTASGQERELHYLKSPFLETVDEVRDKNRLWEYVCTLPFRHVLCLDGDEMLSLSAIRGFAGACHQLEQGGASVIVMPFIYLWNGEDQRRIDGVYNDIHHARLFTIDRAPNYRNARFHARGRAGFHCGSIPEELNLGHRLMPEMRVIHFGYIDNEIRHRKLEFYTELDPNNEGEGYYKHIVGDSNHLAPGPLRLVQYRDQ